MEPQSVALRHSHTLHHFYTTPSHTYSPMGPMSITYRQYILFQSIKAYLQINVRYSNQLLILGDILQQYQFMATFFIDTDHLHYTLGETITGKVLLHIPATISNTQGLRFTFAAFEHNKWQEIQSQSPGKQESTPQSERKLNGENQEVSECRSDGDGEYATRTISRKGKNGTMDLHERKEQIFHASSELLPAGTLKAGQYSFPFSISTRKQWPATSHNKSKDKAERITYTLEVAILPLTVRFQLRQRLQIIMLDPNHQHRFTYAQNVTNFLCMDKGHTRYEANLSKKAYRPGEQGEIVVSVDNSECSADVEGFTLGIASVKRDEAGRVRNEVVEKTIKLQVKGREKEVKIAREHFQIPADELSSKLKGAPSEMTLQLQIRHSGMCSQNKSHQIPVTILPLFYRPSRPQAMQQSWQPTSMKHTTLAPSIHEKPLKNN